MRKIRELDSSPSFMAAGLECRVSRLHEPQDSAEDELESTTVDLNEPILFCDPNSFLKTDSEIGGTPLIVALAPSAGLSLGPYSGIAMPFVNGRKTEMFLILAASVNTVMLPQ